MNLNEMTAQASNFLDMAFAELGQKEFVIDDHWQIDHLCYRTSTPDNYQEIKKSFGNFSDLLAEGAVNGRMISTFKLTKPLFLNGWEINLIEVPAPKTGRITGQGFEHFEIVSDLTFEEIRKRYSQFEFNQTGMSKDFNQELEVIFNNFAVKFHSLSLESVINLEKNSHLFSVVNESAILKILKPFDPIVGGSFPLNLNVGDSDLDIFITASDFELIRKILTENFGNFKTYNCKELEIEGKATLIISFTFKSVKFEIFGQQIPSVKQKGYLHFLAEERLLKIGGLVLLEKLKRAREQGLKTEPAFAQVIGLKGDPYQELLTIQKLSNQNLKSVLKAAQILH